MEEPIVKATILAPRPHRRDHGAVPEPSRQLGMDYLSEDRVEMRYAAALAGSCSTSLTS